MERQAARQAVRQQAVRREQMEDKSPTDATGCDAKYPKGPALMSAVENNQARSQAGGKRSR